MLFLDRVQIAKDKMTLISNEDLKELHEVCQASNALLVVDITRAYPILLHENESISFADYLISDLT